MIYRWEQCPASNFGDARDCVHCINYVMHIGDEPSCECHSHIGSVNLESSSAREKLVHLEPVTSSVDEYKVHCNKCGKMASRDYPLYHIASDIISPYGGVPNPPKCVDCRS